VAAERLGWQLLRALTDQLKATLQIHREIGTTVELTFRELSYKERGW
jgi:two-component sensor histidine kinase